MTDTSGDPEQTAEPVSALRRMVGSSAPEKEDKGASRMALRALRRSFARSAKDLCDLQLAVIGARQLRVVSENLGQFLNDKHLLIVLDGSEGVSGAVTLDGAAVTAIIQQQTMSRVAARNNGERRFTGTDAAMLAPLIDGALENARTMLEGMPEGDVLDGFRFGAHVEGVASLLLSLAAEDYLVFHMPLDLAAGLVQGSMNLILPVPVAADETGGECSGQTGPTLADGTSVVRAELNAVLTRFQLKVEDLLGLKPGDALPVTVAALNATELQTIDGRPVAVCRLGQAGGARAVRLHAKGPTSRRPDPTPEDFAARIGPIDVDAETAGASQQEAERPKLVTAELPIEAAAEQEDLLGLSPSQAAAEITELAGLAVELEQDTVPLGG
ncbi:MAG: hypothetical protein GJ676_12335 [Rhodobacteraceae bacterium]|nr:hypothetical protein [Paracoccaceae bacterium]